MGRINIRPKNRTDRLIMYCKLLKYIRKSQVRETRGGSTLYRRICKNEFFPFVKTSHYPWDKRLYYAFGYSDMYGWMVISLDLLKDVKL